MHSVPGLYNPLPLIINLPTPLIINTPQIWYTIIYWEYLLLGGWGGLLLGGGDYIYVYAHKYMPEFNDTIVISLAM